ncbi:MAG: nicotinate-nucleotide adenylyltransferase [Bacteroidetes bacterium]|nr:nicotinate-nucleotide adenylyltransferase [Bacteroidota bacterium]
MAVGLFGGTFNPVHFGHLITSQRVKELRNLDKIILMPCNISPFKTKKPDILDGEKRIKMLELAIGENPSYEISDYELKKGGVSYTYDTIVHIKKSYPDIELIIGFDNILDFHKWYKPEEIVKEAKLIVLTRKTDNREMKNKNSFFSEAIFVESPMIEISSTGIRERIREGLPIDFLVPRLVVEYIKKEKLYLE